MYDYVEERKNGELSLRAYNLTIGLVLLWGFVVNLLMCKFCTKTFMNWNFTAVVIGYFIVAIAGMLINRFSDNPFISFIGYNMVVLPVGVVLSIALTEYDKISIMNALLTTTVVTLIMIVLAIIIPNVFLSMGKVLFFCLTGVIVCEIIFMFIGFVTPSLWDFGVALIFCGYIGYDWAESQKQRHTLDNAVDSVVDLYLDIVNLFLRILSSSSKSSKND